MVSKGALKISSFLAALATVSFVLSVGALLPLPLQAVITTVKSAIAAIYRIAFIIVRLCWYIKQHAGKLNVLGLKTKQPSQQSLGGLFNI
jgi:hypothetical protein